MGNLTNEERAFIDGIELAIDYMLPITDEDFLRYKLLTGGNA